MKEAGKQKVQEAWMGQAMENLPLHQQSEHLKERSGTVCTVKKHGRKIQQRKI